MMPLDLGEKSAKPVTTVRVYVGTSVRVKLGHIPAMSVA